jgi:hypothetical protein
MVVKERVFLKFTEGYVKIAHVIETTNIIKISLDHENPIKLQRHSEITLHETKTHIKDLDYTKWFGNNDDNIIFIGDPSENDGYPYETTLNGQSVGYNNIPSNILFPIYESHYTSGLSKSFLTQVLNKKGLILDLKQSCLNKFIFKIYFRKDFESVASETKTELIIKTGKGDLIFTSG